MAYAASTPAAMAVCADPKAPVWNRALRISDGSAANAAADGSTKNATRRSPSASRARSSSTSRPATVRLSSGRATAATLTPNSDTGRSATSCA